MGYRSDVYIKVKNKDKDGLVMILKEQDIDDCFSMYSDNEFTYAYASWLKWYQGHKDVDAIEDFINDDEQNRALLTIGEDNATTECGDCAEVGLYMIAEIDTDYFPMDELKGF